MPRLFRQLLDNQSDRMILQRIVFVEMKVGTLRFIIGKHQQMIGQRTQSSRIGGYDNAAIDLNSRGYRKAIQR